MTSRTMRLYGEGNRYLGDTWIALNGYCKLARMMKEPVGLCRYATPESNPIDCFDRLNELLSELEDGHKLVKLTDEVPDWYMNMRELHMMMNYEYHPTKIKWNSQGHMVALQLIGTSNDLKNPTAAQVHDIKRGLWNSGFDIIEIGLPMSVHESIDVMSKCFAFVGCSSGMSHVARSLNMPIVLSLFNGPDNLQRSQEVNWHPGWFLNGSRAYLERSVESILTRVMLIATGKEATRERVRIENNGGGKLESFLKQRGDPV